MAPNVLCDICVYCPELLKSLALLIRLTLIFYRGFELVDCCILLTIDVLLVEEIMTITNGHMQ